MRTGNAQLFGLLPCLVICTAAGAAHLAARSGSKCDNPAYIALDESRAQYPQAIARVRVWLDQLHVDPLELRQHGVKGKKKLTEQLDGYYRLWQIAEPEEKEALLARIREVVAITYEPRYHDLGSTTERWFKQDATSYLRAAVLMERLGLNTQLYRAEIAKIHPRLNDHMKARGPHQRITFHWYYEHFGLQEPFPLGGALEEGIIARRADPAALSDADAYALTHEVFVPYEYGERLDVDPFDAADKAYLRGALEALAARYIAEDDPDLLAEVVSCLRYLRFVDSPAYHEGLAYLLANQNPDGSWGDHAAARAEFGDYGLHGMILHTTVVALDALTVAFHEPWNRDLFPGCGG